MSVKYKEFYKKTLKKNKSLFEDFEIVHEKYAKNPIKYKEEFNRIGGEIMVILKKAEDKLCFQSEQSRFAKYSEQLSQKFWDEVKKDFPKIEEVSTSSNALPAEDIIDDLF